MQTAQIKQQPLEPLEPKWRTMRRQIQQADQ